MDIKEIKIDDLIQDCLACEGTGKRDRVNFQNSNLNRCDTCDGRGKQLTEAGKVLKQFIDEAQKFSQT